MRSEQKPLVQVDNLSVRFPVKGRGTSGKRKFLHAVDDVSFTIQEGETLGLVGESGSGKTTVALALARLIKNATGTTWIEQEDWLSLDTKTLREKRRKVQFIFQDPYSSLNPRWRAEKIVNEPLRMLSSSESISSSRQAEIIDSLFAAVGLRPEQKRLFPHQFSGGQRQRIGIARALATNPKLIICDEPVSALDVAVQAQTLNLLRRLQKEYQLTLFFISHDLRVIQYMCERIAVMYMGNIVEMADRFQLFNRPQHPYTQTLLAAIPSIHATNAAIKPEIKRRMREVPDLTLPSTGCRYALNCPLFQARCHTEIPTLKNVSQSHQVACHFAGEKID